MRKLLTIGLLLVVASTAAQTNTIAHFSVWHPKPGQGEQFEKGYKKHLQWHAANKDTWSWYGWYVILGPRVGYFIDATFDHSWSDFDKPVNPAGDHADNALHTEPFGNFKLSYKVKFLPQLSIANATSLQSTFLRYITLTVTDIEQAKLCIEKLKTNYQTKGVQNFLVYEMADGGSLNQLLVLIGYNNIEAFGKMDNIREELSRIENLQQVKVFTEVVSETWRYQAAMSLFPSSF
ncbi:hypothetical protein [Paraflavitalea speifideaquila]|uniref:hypothetical protein n=1 Tax=Paraflavitalea speifideaquila TaxID=3076558 RepID=UPI0028E7A14A|nr:hypothetical protein [Paraflavitalea speifideiaquila]